MKIGSDEDVLLSRIDRRVWFILLRYAGLHFVHKKIKNKMKWNKLVNVTKNWAIWNTWLIVENGHLDVECILCIVYYLHVAIVLSWSLDCNFWASYQDAPIQLNFEWNAY